jgi:four helix bundle protein
VGLCGGVKECVYDHEGCDTYECSESSTFTFTSTTTTTFTSTSTHTKGIEDASEAEMKLSHEKLDVYQVAVQFLAWSTKLTNTFPRGHAALADQLRRATLSIPLNIAEGSGKTSRAESARYFSIARGSALECGAVLDACKILALARADRIDEGKALLRRAVSMLSKLSR